MASATTPSPANITQHIEPGQIPARLTAADWESIQAQVATDYPLTSDSLSQDAYLKASNTGADDRFGFAVSVSGDTVVVGADMEDSSATGVDRNQSDNSAKDSGAAYVFTRSGATWSQQARPSDGGQPIHSEELYSNLWAVPKQLLPFS